MCADSHMHASPIRNSAHLGLVDAEQVSESVDADLASNEPLLYKIFVLFQEPDAVHVAVAAHCVKHLGESSLARSIPRQQDIQQSKRV